MVSRYGANWKERCLMKKIISFFIIPFLLLNLLITSLEYCNSEETVQESYQWAMGAGDIHRTGRSDYSCSDNIGRIIWEFDFDNLPEDHTNGYGTPCIDQNGNIYFPHRNGYLYSINPSGSLNWKYNCSACVFG